MRSEYPKQVPYLDENGHVQYKQVHSRREESQHYYKHPLVIVHATAGNIVVDLSRRH